MEERSRVMTARKAPMSRSSMIARVFLLVAFGELKRKLDLENVLRTATSSLSSLGCKLDRSRSFFHFLARNACEKIFVGNGYRYVQVEKVVK